ncbi:hypothetical protein CECT7263_5552 [Bifidobacterium breve CECT 7263]|uniref:Uncharacterized protein n=1 Tax=Bifidobacterium breve DSM 20213 = JCM 1192 TaxID=518634 RepID=D4BPG5_BIFBR|nr:hypothetical protein BIFBRE_03974 [Bifidobacterium breve DSM 20213 = JCM 1192]EHS86981.1 hypothetical protein CECT7263_5552 [Bifidobacterium breve CECT 7263]
MQGSDDGAAVLGGSLISAHGGVPAWVAQGFGAGGLVRGDERVRVIGVLEVQVAEQTAAHQSRTNDDPLLLSAGQVKNAAIQQVLDTEALGHSRDTAINLFSWKSHVFDREASSSVTFALKYRVFGFWNTLPNSGVGRSIGTVSTSIPHVVWRPANTPWENEGISPLTTRV